MDHETALIPAVSADGVSHHVHVTGPEHLLPDPAEVTFMDLPDPGKGMRWVLTHEAVAER